MVRWLSLVFGGALLLGALGCEQGPTQLLVVVDSDLAPEHEISRVLVYVADPGVSLPARPHRELRVRPRDVSIGPGQVRLPFSFGVTPRNDPDSEVRIVLRALRVADSGSLTEVVTTSARAGFVEYQSLLLPMFLYGACANTELECAEGETCAVVDSVPQCVPELVENLEPIEPGQETPRTTRVGDPRWVGTVGGGGAGRPLAMAIVPGTQDAIVVGSTSGQLDGVDGTPGSTSADTDALVVQVAADGRTLSVQSFGGAGEQEARAVVVDPTTGRIVVAGTYTVGLEVDGSPRPIRSRGGRDLFVVAVDPDGSPRLMRTLGSHGDDELTAMAVDGRNGNMVLAGHSDAEIAPFDTHPPGAFLVGLLPDGSPAWSRSLTSEPDARIHGLDIDPSTGDVLVVGTFRGTSDFGDGAKTSMGDEDGFVLRTDDRGVTRWSDALEGAMDDGCFDVTVVPDTGDAWIACSFRGRGRFGGRTLWGTGASPPTDQNLAVARLRPNGDVPLINYYEGDGDVRPTGILWCPGDGRIAISGTFSGTLDLSGRTAVTRDGRESFVAQIQQEYGRAIYVRRFGPEATVTSLATDSFGMGSDDPWVAGYFSDSVDFGDGVHRGADGEDVFVVRVE